MKTLHLPFLPEDTSPEEAYKAMQWLQKSAVVRQGESEHALITAGKIVHAVVKDWSKLSKIGHDYSSYEISSGEVEWKKLDRVYHVSPDDSKSMKLDRADPMQTRFEYEQLLDKKHVPCALVDSVPGIGLVVIRNDEMATKLSMAPGTCYCTGPFEHPYPPPHKVDGNPCDLCPYNIECLPKK